MAIAYARADGHAVLASGRCACASGPTSSTRKSNPLVPGVRRALRNRPFRVLLACYVVGEHPGRDPRHCLMPYFNRYVLNPPPIATTRRMAGSRSSWRRTSCRASSACRSGSWLARRIGKKPTPGSPASSWASPAGSRSSCSARATTLACLILIAWSGSSFGAGLFLPPAIQADVIDYDELHTGKRREAQYLALWGLVPKFIVIPSASIPLALLALARLPAERRRSRPR